MAIEQWNNPVRTQVAWPRRWYGILAGCAADAHGFFRSPLPLPLTDGGRVVNLLPLEALRYLAVHTGTVF